MKVNNKYETTFDKALEKQNSKYFRELKGILEDYEEHLIENEIIPNKNFDSYVRLLKQISKDSGKDFGLTYNLGISLEKLEQKHQIEQDLLKIGVNIHKNLNSLESKTRLYGQKIRETKDAELNRARLAEIILEVFDEKDFDLTTVKIKIFKILNPNSEMHFFKYVSKPTRE